MSENLDLISPVGMGSDKIVITVNNPTGEQLLVGTPITLDFNYAAAQPAGISLPLILQVQPAFGRGVGYKEVVFRDRAPNSFAFSVPGAGQYLVVLRECFHMRWQGRILIDVAGEEFSQILSTRQEP